MERRENGHDGILELAPPSRQEQSRRSAREHERRNPDEHPFERMEGGGCDRRLRVAEVPAQVGPIEGREASQGKHRRRADRDEDAAECPAADLVLPRELEVDDLELRGQGFKPVRFRGRDGFSQQRAHGRLYRLREGD